MVKYAIFDNGRKIGETTSIVEARKIAYRYAVKVLKQNKLKRQTTFQQWKRGKEKYERGFGKITQSDVYFIYVMDKNDYVVKDVGSVNVDLIQETKSDYMTKIGKEYLEGTFVTAHRKWYRINKDGEIIKKL